jgi:NAD(P)H-hydrate epimerase
MKVLTAAQMREIDRRASAEFGVAGLTLMENAGARVVETMVETHSGLRDGVVAVLCGKGNNGGDGLVVARLLREHGVTVDVFLCADPAAVKGDAATNLKRWRDAGGELRIVKTEADWRRESGALAKAGVIVDALLGTGLTGPVEGILRTVIEDLNALPHAPRVFAVDIPSGLSSDRADSPGPAIHAHHTVALAAPKVGEVFPANQDSVGRLTVADIGIPAKLIEETSDSKIRWLEPGEFCALPLERKRSAHKGSYGHVLLAAGSRGKTGAAVLAARGALRVGAGLVTVATAKSVLPIVAAGMPELMTHALPETDAQSISMASFDYGAFAALWQGKNVLALGPGLSTHDETQRFVRATVRDCPLPIILDADGLNAFAGRAGELRDRQSALLAVTPHPGEMARLLGCTAAEVQARRLKVAQKSAADWNAIVVLKGQGTLVAAPDGTTFVNSTGNPGMAKGGTGDVLTGILAGLTAQFGTADWARVLGLGVYLHGLAGDLASAELGEHGLLASDLAERLPAALLRVLAGIRQGG